MGWEERNKYWYMKNFLLMLGAVAFMTACKNDSPGNSGPVNYEDGYKYLTSLNVSDAKMIYQKTATGRTRAETGDTYYKLDLSGNEIKLSIKGEDGQDNNINISKVVKLSDKVILVNPVAQEVLDLFYNPVENDLVINLDYHSTEYMSIVDVETEKLYRWPKEILIDIYEGTLKSQQDNKGNIYFTSGNFSYNQIYKLNISDFTMQSMLPEGQEFTNFDVTGDGFIMYWNDNTDDKNYKVKCPGGRIYPITDVPFMIKDELYSYKDKKIIKWETVGNNEMKETKICEFYNLPDYASSSDRYEIQQVLNNYAKNTALLRDNWGSLYEFNGETYSEVEIPQDFNWYELEPGCFYTNKAWYRQDNTHFNKLSMNDYQVSEFQVLDYEIQSISTSSESSNITFTGIRYMDGANIVGTINESNEIVENKVSENGEKIINLIPLN
ncbi:hypothetical protein [Bacteroides sp. ET336]|uniref:hypothetical protein n=1 Tax=Bacteroides sp. ET336 TaxID=2972459 RepID=UPI0021ABED6D|nr:hypothetical protein [Bacteroides sp. ET336]